MAKAPLVRKSFHLPGAVVRALEEVAAQEGVKFSVAVRRVLQRGLEITPPQLPVSLPGGSRRDRAALILTQLIQIRYGHFKRWRDRDANLDNSAEELQQIKQLARIAWTCSGYLEEPAELEE